MFVSDSGYMLIILNSLKNTTNLWGVKTVAKTGNKKMIMGSLWGYWKGYQKRYFSFYLVKCTDTEYIKTLSLNIFSVTRALAKGSNTIPEKESFVIKENAIILKFEERQDHGNVYVYLMTTRIYTSWNYLRKNTQKWRICKGMIPIIRKGRKKLHKTWQYMWGDRQHIVKEKEM